MISLSMEVDLVKIWRWNKYAFGNGPRSADCNIQISWKIIRDTLLIQYRFRECQHFLCEENFVNLDEWHKISSSRDIGEDVKQSNRNSSRKMKQCNTLPKAQTGASGYITKWSPEWWINTNSSVEERVLISS